MVHFAVSMEQASKYLVSFLCPVSRGIQVSNSIINMFSAEATTTAYFLLFLHTIKVACYDAPDTTRLHTLP
jgi:hypothetical protein